MAHSDLPLLQAAASRRVVPAPDGPAPGPPPADWIDRLLGSELFRQQRRAASRLAPGDEQVRRALRELDRRGGQMTADAFAARVGLPPLRLHGFIAQVQRMLNLDGYPILDLDRDRDAVTLDVPLLKRQFELE